MSCFRRCAPENGEAITPGDHAHRATAKRLKTTIRPQTVPWLQNSTVLRSPYKGEGTPPFRERKEARSHCPRGGRRQRHAARQPRSRQSAEVQPEFISAGDRRDPWADGAGEERPAAAPGKIRFGINASELCEPQSQPTWVCRRRGPNVPPRLQNVKPCSKVRQAIW